MGWGILMLGWGVRERVLRFFFYSSTRGRKGGLDG